MKLSKKLARAFRANQILANCNDINRLLDSKTLGRILRENNKLRYNTGLEYYEHDKQWDALKKLSRSDLRRLARP